MGWSSKWSCAAFRQHHEKSQHNWVPACRHIGHELTTPSISIGTRVVLDLQVFLRNSERNGWNYTTAAPHSPLIQFNEPHLQNFSKRNISLVCYHFLDSIYAQMRFLFVHVFWSLTFLLLAILSISSLIWLCRMTLSVWGRFWIVPVLSSLSDGVKDLSGRHKKDPPDQLAGLGVTLLISADYSGIL